MSIKRLLHLEWHLKCALLDLESMTPHSAGHLKIVKEIVGEIIEETELLTDTKLSKED